MQVTSNRVSYVFAMEVSSVGTPTKDLVFKWKQNKTKHFADGNYFSFLLFCDRTYCLESAYHMKFKLFILINHVLHISILYPFRFSSWFSLFPVLFLPSLVFTLTCGKGSDPTKTAGSAHNHVLLIFERKETTFFALNYPLGWQSIPSVSCWTHFPKLHSYSQDHTQNHNR